MQAKTGTFPPSFLFFLFIMFFFSLWHDSFHVISCYSIFFFSSRVPFLQSLCRVFGSFILRIAVNALTIVRVSVVNLPPVGLTSLHPPPEANKEVSSQVAPPLLPSPLNAFFPKEIIRRFIHWWPFQVFLYMKESAAFMSLSFCPLLIRGWSWTSSIRNTLLEMQHPRSQPRPIPDPPQIHPRPHLIPI